MKKIKCTSIGNFSNLTIEKEYEVLNESRDLYTINNDIDIEAKYHKKYFAEVSTKKEPIRVFEIECERDSEGMNVTITVGVTGNTHDLSTYLPEKLVAGNCGVSSYDNMNDICAELNSTNELTEESIEAVVTAILQEAPRSITMFSTNKQYPLLWTVLDRMANFQSEERINTNSNNPIKVWGFYTK